MKRPDVSELEVVRPSYTIEYLLHLKTFKSKLVKHKDSLTSALKY